MQTIMSIHPNITELVTSLRSPCTRALTKSEQVEVAHLIGTAVDIDPTINLNKAVTFLLEIEFGIRYDKDKIKNRGGDRAAGQCSTRKRGGNGMKKRRSKTSPLFSITNDDQGYIQIKRTKDKDVGNKVREKKVEKNGDWTPEELDEMEMESLDRQYIEAFRTLWKKR